MTKKSDPHTKPLLYIRKQAEFRQCDAPDCANIVSTIDLPRKFEGPIYCILHRHGHA